MPKRAFIIVALSWVVVSLVGALPFYISGEIPNYIDAFFETVSGFYNNWIVHLKRCRSIYHSVCCSGEVSLTGLEVWECLSLSDADESGQEEFHVSDACRSFGTGER